MCRLVQKLVPVSHVDQAARAALTAILLLVIVGPTRMTLAEDGPKQVHGTNTTPRQAIDRATYLEPGRLSFADSDAPRPLPPAKRGSLSEKTDSPRALGAIVSVAGSLTVVLGLFFVLTWLMRRGMPNSAMRLPDDVVSVLGRAPLAGRQQVHVLRFGNKLLLVCASTSGFDKLAEITEPEEVQRIVSLCDRSESGIATSAASRVFGRIIAGGSRGRSPRESPRLGIQSESARGKEAADA
jgi:flagellar biogenesis protein FliO